jgi:F0F1-type ATP synthase epsilon subunit
MSLISALKAGRVRVRQAGHETAYEITSGVLEVDLDHNVTLLADQATLL